VSFVNEAPDLLLLFSVKKVKMNLKQELKMPYLGLALYADILIAMNLKISLIKQEQD
jgi:hypothetical protein